MIIPFSLHIVYKMSGKPTIMPLPMIRKPPNMPPPPPMSPPVMNITNDCKKSEYTNKDECKTIADAMKADLLKLKDDNDRKRQIIKEYNEFLRNYIGFLEIKNTMYEYIEENKKKPTDNCETVDYTLFNYVVEFDRKLVRNINNIEELKNKYHIFKRYNINTQLEKVNDELFFNSLWRNTFTYVNFVTSQLDEYEKLLSKLKKYLKTQVNNPNVKKEDCNIKEIKVYNFISNNMLFKGDIDTEKERINTEFEKWRKNKLLPTLPDLKKKSKEIETERDSVRRSITQGRNNKIPGLVDIDAANKQLDELDILFNEINEILGNK